MAYLVFGSLTYSNQTNRNTALSALNSSLAGHNPTDVASAYPAGINTSGTTGITISVVVDDENFANLLSDFISGWSAATRATSGQVHGVVKI